MMEAHTATSPAPLRAPSLRGLRVGEERLAHQIARGDESAFRPLYDRYHQPLYRYCRSLLRNMSTPRTRCNQRSPLRLPRCGATNATRRCARGCIGSPTTSACRCAGPTAGNAISRSARSRPARRWISRWSSAKKSHSWSRTCATCQNASEPRSSCASSAGSRTRTSRSRWRPRSRRRSRPDLPDGLGGRRADAAQPARPGPSAALLRLRGLRRRHSHARETAAGARAAVAGDRLRRDSRSHARRWIRSRRRWERRDRGRRG